MIRSIARLLFSVGCALTLLGCGYHLGGVKSRAMAKVNTVCVDMFTNSTFYPNVALQTTTALTETIQRDGAFRLASPSQCDAVLSGNVSSVVSSVLRTNSRNTYLSAEIGLTVHVHYVVTETATGRVLTRGIATGEGSYFNDDTGNVQTARDSALSYATRLAVEQIMQNLTIP